MTIFRVKSVKIYTGQKKFTRAPLVVLVTNMRYGKNYNAFQCKGSDMTSRAWSSLYRFGENRMPQLTNAQVLLVKNSGGADLDFLAIHLYHPEAPESQNNQVVTPVRLYSKRHLYIRGCFDLAPPQWSSSEYTTLAQDLCLDACKSSEWCLWFLHHLRH